MNLQIPRLERHSFTTWKVAIIASATSIGTRDHVIGNPDPPATADAMATFRVSQASAKLLIIDSMAPDISIELSPAQLDDTPTT